MKLNNGQNATISICAYVVLVRTIFQSCFLGTCTNARHVTCVCTPAHVLEVANRLLKNQIAFLFSIIRNASTFPHLSNDLFPFDYPASHTYLGQVVESTYSSHGHVIHRASDIHMKHCTYRSSFLRGLHVVQIFKVHIQCMHEQLTCLADQIFVRTPAINLEARCSSHCYHRPRSVNSPSFPIVDTSPSTIVLQFSLLLTRHK